MLVYDIIFDGEEALGVNAISLVKKPAIKETFIAMETDPEIFEFKFSEVDKQVVLGAILIPDRLIKRIGEDGEFFIRFSEDVIERVAYAYLERGNQSNATVQHKDIAEGVFLAESWIVKDPDKDKSALYDLALPVGSWVGLMKLSDPVWEQYVKTGEVEGFSIEGMFDMKLTGKSDKHPTPVSSYDPDLVDMLARIYSLLK